MTFNQFPSVSISFHQFPSGSMIFVEWYLKNNHWPSWRFQLAVGANDGVVVCVIGARNGTHCRPSKWNASNESNNERGSAARCSASGSIRHQFEMEAVKRVLGMGTDDADLRLRARRGGAPVTALPVAMKCWRSFWFDTEWAMNG